MNETKKHLSNFKEAILNYYPISDKAFTMFEEISTFKSFKKDEILLNIGQVAREIYFVCQGALIAYFTDNDGNTYNKNIFLENQLQVREFRLF